MCPANCNTSSACRQLRRRDFLIFATLSLSAAAWLAWAALRGEGGGLVAAAIGAVSLVVVFTCSRLIARRRTFCPHCGALVAHGLWRGKRKYPFCYACGKLAAPSAVLVGPPKILDFSHPERLARIPATSAVFCIAVLTAVCNKAIEVVVLPLKDYLKITYLFHDGKRVDHVPPPFRLTRDLIATIKAIAGLDVGTDRHRQDGEIDVVFADSHVRMFVAVEPGEFGEKVVLRLPGIEKETLAPLAAKYLANVDGLMDRWGETVYNGVVEW